MFRLTNYVFIALLCFSESLATKCMSLNNELCMIRPTLIDLYPAELKCYPFMINLDKCSGSCNSVNNLSIKMCVPNKTEDINVKVFHMITNSNEAKTMAKHISCDCKRKRNSTTCNSNQKWSNETCQCECKNYNRKKYYL